MKRLRHLLVCSVASAALLGCSLDRSPMGSVVFRSAGADQAGWEQLYETGKTQLAAGYYGLALQKFRAALDRNPGSVELLNAVGVTYDRLGRYDIARVYYDRALAIEPGSVETLNNIGYSFVLRGRYADAVPYFDKVLAMGAKQQYRDVVAANRALAVARLVDVQVVEGQVEEPGAVVRAPLSQQAEVSARSACTPTSGVRIAIAGERVHRLITDPAADQTVTHSCTGEPASRVAFLRSLSQAAPVIPVESAPVETAAVRADNVLPQAAQRADLPERSVAFEIRTQEPLAPSSPLPLTAPSTPTTPVSSPTPKIAEAAPVDVADASAESAFAHLVRATADTSRQTVVTDVDAKRPVAKDANLAPRWVEVSNGAGRNRLAARFRGYMQANGLPVSYLTNDVTFSNLHSVVFYKPGFRSAAERYATLLPVAVELRQHESMYADVRILLGGDVLDFDVQTLLVENKGKPNA